MAAQVAGSSAGRSTDRVKLSWPGRRSHDRRPRCPVHVRPPRMVALTYARHRLCTDLDAKVCPTEVASRNRVMNKHLLASSFSRWVAPLVLAGATFCGTLGVSSVASAQEPARDGSSRSHVIGKGPREHGERVAHRRWAEPGHRHHGRVRPGHHGPRGHGRGGDHSDARPLPGGVVAEPGARSSEQA